MRDPDLLVSLLHQMAMNPAGELASSEATCGEQHDEEMRAEHLALLERGLTESLSRGTIRITHDGFHALAVLQEHPPCRDVFSKIIGRRKPVGKAMDAVLRHLASIRG